MVQELQNINDSHQEKMCVAWDSLFDQRKMCLILITHKIPENFENAHFLHFWPRLGPGFRFRGPYNIYSQWTKDLSLDIKKNSLSLEASRKQFIQTQKFAWVVHDFIFCRNILAVKDWSSSCCAYHVGSL